MNRELRVLLVDHNLGDLELLRDALTTCRSDLEVTLATDGAMALAYLRGQVLAGRPIALVVLDLDLPKVGGLAVLDELRTSAQSPIPVVVLSSSAASSDVEQAYEHGASAYVVKPYDVAEYQMTLDTITHFWCRTILLPMASL